MMDDKAQKNKALAQALGWKGLHQIKTRPELWFGVPAGEKFTGVYDKVAVVPDWYGSVDATLTMLPEDYAVSFWRERGEDCCQLYSTEFGAWDGQGATRAEALANATLVWAQAQHGQGGEGGGDA